MKGAQQLPVLLAGLAVAGLLAFVLASVLEAASVPEGPVDVVWDRETCAHCRMHVGEPAFASQVQTTDGDVMVFDDPGCAFELIARVRPDVHAVWFHHCREDRWLPSERTAFVEVSPTPMGYGLGAVDAGTSGAMTIEDARTRVLGRGEPR